MRSHRPHRWLGYALLGAAFGLGILGGVAGALGAATRISSPPVFLGAGYIAGAMIAAGLAYPAARALRHSRRLRTAVVMAAVVALVLASLTAPLFYPPLTDPVPPESRALPPGATRWTLATGSEVAVLRVQGRGAPTRPPIVFLHGGPGGFSVGLAPTVEAISTLAEDGHDLYFYDQVGGGLSARLADVTEYSLERHLADLEAVIARIGSDQVVFIGSSFGSTLGAHYISRHPDQVARAVFSGASALFAPAWRASGTGSLDDSMSPGERRRFSEAIEKPRLFAAIALAQLNPRAAARFAPEAELGAFFDEVANAFYLPLTVCRGSSPSVRSSGYGFWSNRITGASLARSDDDPRPRLRTVATPVLVLRGACDYKKEAVAREYAEVFPEARFVQLEGAGHMPYLDALEPYLAEVRPFLQAPARSLQPPPGL